MTRRFLIFSFVAGLLALGGLNAQAESIPLPTTVDNLAFSAAATYTVNPAGSPPPASAVSAVPFTSVPGEPGIQFNGAFTAAAGQTVDYAITYTVMTTDGSKISDAFLSLGGFTNNGGTGSVSIGETIANSSGTVISKVLASAPALCKLYVIREATGAAVDPQNDPCYDFLTLLLPEIDRCVFSGARQINVKNNEGEEHPFGTIRGS